MSTSLCLLATVFVLAFGADLCAAQSGSGSGSGSGFVVPLIPLASTASLSQEQRNNIVEIGFAGITEEQFFQIAPVFVEEVANIVNMYLNNGRQLVRRQQATLTPSDITVLEGTRMEGGVLYIAFVVSGTGGQSPLLTATEMVALLEAEGNMLAMALSAALNTPVRFTGVRILSNGQPQLSQAVIIGIVVGVVVAVVLVAAIMITVAVVSCIKTIRKRRGGKAMDSYVEVPEQNENNFSSNWQSMKVNPKGDYAAAPNSFGGEGNNTAL